MRRRRTDLVVHDRGRFGMDRADDIRSKAGRIPCGHEAEKLAREAILPTIGCNPVEGRSGLVRSEHVPFDVIAKHKNELWLVEVKVASPYEPSVPPVQRRRMLKLCCLLAEAGITAVPMLLWVDHWSASYVLFGFPATSCDSAGEDADLPGLADSVADWVTRTKVSHPS